MQMGPISQSQMYYAEHCPHSWYFYRIKAQQIQGDMTYMTIGTIIHESIEEYFKVIGDNPHSGQITGTFKSIVDKNWAVYESLLKEYSGRKDKCVANFVNFEVNRSLTAKKYKPTLLEQDLKAIIGRIEYRAIVDAFWEEEGLIADWKTGNKNMLSAQDYLQGQIETMILREHGYTVKKVVFVSLFSGLVLELPKVTDEYVHEKAMKMINYWNTGKFPKNRGQGCNMCQWNLRCKLEDRGICVWQL